MRVLGIVGSPRKGGNTDIMIRRALEAAEKCGAETRVIYLRDFNLNPCQDCRTCIKTGKCAIEDDLEKVIEELLAADGIIIGSPVYYGSVTSQIKTFIDRVGRVTGRGRGYILRKKVGGAIVVARRDGTLTTLSQILFLLLSARMTIPGGWSLGFGWDPGDVLKDEEGIQRAQELGEAIAYLLEKLKTNKQ